MAIPPINFASFLALDKIGAVIDLEKRKLDLNLGRLTLKGIKLPALKALTKNVPKIEKILSETFIQRSVLWVEFHVEQSDECLSSIRALQTKCEAIADEFAATTWDKDHVISSMYRALANSCKHTASKLEYAEQVARKEMAIQGFVPYERSPGAYIPKALAPLRQDAYPFVEFLITLLPEKNVVRKQAQQHLDRGRDVTIAQLGLSSAALCAPSIVLNDDSASGDKPDVDGVEKSSGQANRHVVEPRKPSALRKDVR